MNRGVIAIGLLVGAGAWVALLAATSGVAKPVQPSAATTNGGSAAAKALVKFVDKSNFAADNNGEITLRLDVLDASGKPIADLKPEHLSVAEGDLPGRIKSFKGPASQAVNVVLVIDVSGSMAQQDRIGGAKRAARAALQTLQNGRDRIGLVAFDTRFEFRLPFGPLTAEYRERCEDVINALRPRAGTIIGPPVVAALESLESAKPDGLKMVLVLTDGEDNDRRRFSRIRNDIGRLSEKLGVQVHTIAVGDEVGQDGEDDLRDLAAKGKGRYEHAPEAEKLAELFRSRVAETVNECTLVYDSPYPTPDGFDRPIAVTIKTPAGPLTATADYKIGPLLSGRSQPAKWALATPTSAGNATEARVSGGLRGPLFAGLLLAIIVLLALPMLRRSAAPSESAPIAQAAPQPMSIRPPPPPPPTGRGDPRPAPPPPRTTAPMATPARPSAGSVLKPPPPPPPKK